MKKSERTKNAQRLPVGNALLGKISAGDAFLETKNMLAEITSFVKYPVTYELWMTIDDEYKAAALYVNFYAQIVIAKNKYRTTHYVDDEDMVSIVMQYLVKNVKKIKSDRKRFTCSYIYTVVYRAIFGLVRTASDHKLPFNISSQYFNMDGEEHDVFEILEDTSNCFTNEKFAKIFESLSDSEIKMYYHIIWGTRLNKPEQRKGDEILDSLKKAFASLYERDDDAETDTETTNTAKSHRKPTFGDIYEMDDEVRSAVCTMSDGEQAVYYGETHISHEGQIKVVFFGAKRDYFVPLDIAKMLEVNDVEMY